MTEQPSSESATENGDASAAAGATPPDLTAVSAEDFAALVANASDEQLEEAMTGPQRQPALREIFSRIADHLDPEKAKGKDAVVHFQILGAPDGGHDDFEVIVRDGKCEVSENPSENPRVTLKVEPVAFLKLITNQKSGPELFMTGKLKIEGDLMFAPQIAGLFQIPTAPKQEGSN
jgi:putative sterol carrier protein